MAATDVDLSGLINTANPASEFTAAEANIQGILTGGGFNLVDFIFFIIGVFFLWSLSYSALKFVLGEGDPQRIAAANKRIINSILGLILTLLSFVIVKIAATIFGFGQGSPNNILPF